MMFQCQNGWFQCRSETNHILNENVSFLKRSADQRYLLIGDFIDQKSGLWI